MSRHQLDVASAETVATKLLDRREPPSALFTANNRNTIGAYRAIHRRGASTALAEFDDFELADARALPLTVVSYDMRELGRQAAQLLCDRMDDPTREPRRLIVPTTVVEYD